MVKRIESVMGFGLGHDFSWWSVVVAMAIFHHFLTCHRIID